MEKGPTPWVIPPIQCNEPEDGVLYAQMGPTGGKQGYPAITGTYQPISPHLPTNVEMDSITYLQKTLFFRYQEVQM